MAELRAVLSRRQREGKPHVLLCGGSQNKPSAPALQSVSSPRWTSATIQDSMYMNNFSFHCVINCERKTLRETTVIREDKCVNSCVQKQRIDIREQAIQEVSAQHWFPVFIETETLQQVFLGFIQDFDFHSLLRMFALAVSQSVNREVPSATWRARSASASLCQDGDSTTSGVRIRSSHKASIAESLSWRVMSLSGRLKDMKSVYSRVLWIQNQIFAREQEHCMTSMLVM